MEKFEQVVSPIIDKCLGPRCSSYGYRYSEIVRSLMTVYFCGGSRVEDVSNHLLSHLGLHPFLRTCSSRIASRHLVARGRVATFY
jgi:hypothetical protein